MRRPSFLTAVAALLAAACLVPTASAAYRTSESAEAQISNPNQECAVYSYPPVAQVIHQEYPQVWNVASIVPGDTAAMAKFQSIQSQIPNIQPNGVAPGSYMGNWSNFTYPASDPNCWWTYRQCITSKLPGIPPDLAAVPEPNTLGYGFDDGPNCSHNAFYDFLQQNNQKATMFYIGSNVADWPLEAQRGLADGHELCVHTWSHRYMTALTNEQVFAELYYSMQIIKLVVGITPTCWRGPFGDVDDRVRSIAHALGLRTIVWRYDSNDWRVNTTVNGTNITAADVDANYEALIARASNGTFDTGGTIMLTHELNNFTMSEAVRFYNQLKSAFKYLVPMGVATNQSKPYVEQNYSLPSFEQYISGTTSLAPVAASGTAGAGQARSTNPAHSGARAARPSHGSLGALAVSAVVVGSLLKWV